MSETAQYAGVLPEWYAEALKPDKSVGVLAHVREPADPNSLEHFEWFVRRLKLENGRRMRLERFQRMLLAGYFAGVTEIAIILPKKNGKTMLMAALALHHMLYEVDEADVIIAAASREQAAKLYQYAEGLILRNPFLNEIVKPQGGYRRIVFRNHKVAPGSIRIIPNDPRTADGQSPTCAVVDELHRHKSAEIYGLLRDGLPAREGKLLSISTAGESEDTPLGHIRESGHNLPIQHHEGRHFFSINEDNTFAFHEWGLADEDDPEDFKVVKMANPLHIHTPRSLQRRFMSPSMMRWQWLRFSCGIWSITEGGVLDGVDLRACGGGLGLAEGESCWVGLDIGWRIDSSALVPFVYDESAPEAEREIVGVPTIIPAPGRGRDTNPKALHDAFRALHARNPIEAVVFDPNAEGHHVAAWLMEELGVNVVEHSQDPSPMSMSAMALAEKIRAHGIVFPTSKDLPVDQFQQGKMLMAHLANAGSRAIGTGSEKWRFVKQGGNLQIDAAIALAMVRRARVEGLGKGKERKPMALTEIRELYGVAA